MRYHEKIAYKILKEKGWSPKRPVIAIAVNDGIGMRKNPKYTIGTPDFECSENRYVEVKFQPYDGKASVYIHQLEVWNDLCGDNKEVYLMIIDKNLKYKFVRVNIELNKVDL